MGIEVLPIDGAMSVKERAKLMSIEILAIDGKKSVQEAATKMTQLWIGSLLVKREGSYVGMITEVDIIRKVVAKRRRPSTVLIEEVMSSPLITIEADESIVEANRLMESHNIRHLAVTRSGKVVGVVSIRDFFQALTLKKEVKI